MNCRGRHNAPGTGFYFRHHLGNHDGPSEELDELLELELPDELDELLELELLDELDELLELELLDELDELLELELLDELPATFVNISAATAGFSGSRSRVAGATANAVPAPITAAPNSVVAVILYFGMGFSCVE